MHVCARTHLYLHILLEHLTKYLLAPSEAQIPQSVPTLNLRLEKVPEYNLSNVYNSPHPLGPAHGPYTLREASCRDLSPMSPALSRHTAVCALCSLFPALLRLHRFLKYFSCLFSLLGEQKPRLQSCLDAGSMLDSHKPATLSWLISLRLSVSSSGGCELVLAHKPNKLFMCLSSCSRSFLLTVAGTGLGLWWILRKVTVTD